MSDHTTKRCTQCKQEFPATLEYFNSRSVKLSKDGLYSWCKKCCAVKARAYYDAHLDERKAYRNKHYRENRDTYLKHAHDYQKKHPEQHNESTRKYNRTHPEKMREIGRRSYWNNREKRVQYARDHRVRHPRQKIVRDAEYWKRRKAAHLKCCAAYQRNHPEAHQARQARRRARKMNAGGTYTVRDIKAQYKRQRGKCYYCGCKLGKEYHVDHVVPLSRGGSNGPENLVIACPFCNLSKNDKLPHEWPEGGRLC